MKTSKQSRAQAIPKEIRKQEAYPSLLKSLEFEAPF